MLSFFLLNFTFQDICENVIAMGLPADSFLQSVARNPLDTVARYLKEKHGGCYKIYNL